MAVFEEGAKVGAVKIAKQRSVCGGRGVAGNKPSYRDEVKGRLTRVDLSTH